MPIYCIGDSHVDFFSGQDEIQPLWPKPSNDLLPYFKTFRLGAVLAYNLCEYGAGLKGREALFLLLDRRIPAAYREIPPGSKVLLCFGEIDCRAHLLKQAELQKKPIESVVEECVKRYFGVIMEIQQLGYEVMVWNAVPSSRYDSIPNKEFPAHGTSLKRNQVTKLFNDYLSDRCCSGDAAFITIFDDLVDEQGLTRMEYYFDYVHLSQKAMPLALSKLTEIVGDLNHLKTASIGGSGKLHSFYQDMVRRGLRLLNVGKGQ